MQPTTKKITHIAFLGDATLPPTDPAYQLAFETSSLLAQNGYIIVNGGGPGIMGASTLGAKKSGGKVEIVTLDPQHAPKENYEGIDQHSYSQADKIYTTTDYASRLNKLIEVADAFVIFKGGTGTLSEVGLTWELAKFEFGHHEPLIFFGPEWQEVVDVLMKNMNYESVEKRVVTVVNSPREVLETLKKI